MPFSEIRTNLLSGLTVALAMVPEAIAFALVAQVSPLTGLYAAFIVALITSAFGGRPGMVSGAAGSLAVVMVALVATHGAQYLFAAVVLMGVFQVLFAVAKLGKLIRMVPHPVMLGFVNGLAIVIFKAQLGHFKTGGAGGALHWMSGGPLGVMLGLTALTMAIIYLFPKLTKSFPATLAGILVVTLLVLGLGIPTKTVGDMGSIRGGFPVFHIPQVPLTWETLRIVAPYSLILAAIGLIETLLTLNLVDEISGTRGRPNRECLAQGVANVVTGFFGGMGGCAMIGQSMINVNAGATRRLSGIFMALLLLSFILFASPWIERIPLAALVGVMFVVCQKTFSWSSLQVFGKVPGSDALLVVAVTVITLLTDLAVAVVLGVVLAALVFAWEQAKRIRVGLGTDEDGRKVYHLEGSLFFASTARFLSLFEPRQDPEDVVVDFRSARVVDHSALEAIDTLAERYRNEGKRLHLRHLSPDCQEILDRAKDMVEVNILEDPTYRVADSRLG
nr:SulP family inorganic anion transporter [uncultured Holophaga sp.]